MKLPLVLAALLLFSCPFTAEANDELSRRSGILPFFSGEKITYAIKKFGIKAGDAVLVFEGKTVLEGRDVYLITFTADGFNFFDEEKIYVDPETFFPVRVERNINIFGNREKITEYYDPQKGRVRIVKSVGAKTIEQVIEKSGDIDNIYCFIYRYRRDGHFRTGDTMEIPLPTKDITIRLLKKNRIAAARKVYNAFFMQSNPRKYRVWFEDNDGKTPLRIDGATGFGNTAMIMRKYERGEKR